MVCFFNMKSKVPSSPFLTEFIFDHKQSNSTFALFRHCWSSGGRGIVSAFCFCWRVPVAELWCHCHNVAHFAVNCALQNITVRRDDWELNRDEPPECWWCIWCWQEHVRPVLKFLRPEVAAHWGWLTLWRSPTTAQRGSISGTGKHLCWQLVGHSSAELLYYTECV